MSDQTPLPEAVILAEGEPLEETEVSEEEETEEGKPATPPAAAATPTTVQMIEADPYDFETCQVQIGIVLLPKVGDEPRLAFCGVRTHLDAPVFATVPADTILKALPAEIAALVEEVKAQFPERAMERLGKKEKKKGVAPKPAVPQVKPAPQPAAAGQSVPTETAKQVGLFDNI